VIRLSSSTLKCSHGLAFGSRVISGDQVFDYLPESIFEKIVNRQEFIGLFALDRLLCNCDGRQAVFCRREPNRNFRAHFIPAPMKRHAAKNRQLITSVVAVELLASLSRFAAATQYRRNARHTETEGYQYTAAMQWRKAATLFDSDDGLADRCWREWERIMRLPRRLAAPIV